MSSTTNEQRVHPIAGFTTRLHAVLDGLADAPAWSKTADEQRAALAQGPRTPCVRGGGPRRGGGERGQATSGPSVLEAGADVAAPPGALADAPVRRRPSAVRAAAQRPGDGASRHRSADLRQPGPAAGLPGRGGPRCPRPRSGRGLRGPRPRPRAPLPQSRPAHRARHHAGRLHRRRLRPAGGVVPRPPHRPVVAGRPHLRRQRPAALPLPPHPGALPGLSPHELPTDKVAFTRRE